MPESHAPRRQPPLDSLATRIIFVVFLATLLTAAVVSWISVHSTYAFLRKRIDASFPARLDQGAGRAVAWLAEGRAALALWGESLAEAPPERAEPVLAARVAESPVFVSLVLVESGGEVLAAAGAFAADALVEATWHAEHGLLGIDVPGVGPVVLAVHPLPAPTGGPARRLVGVVDTHALRDRTAPSDVGPHTIYLLDAAGRVVGPAGAQAEMAPEGVRDAAQGTAVYRGRGGGFVVGAARPLGLPGWQVVLEQPFRQAFEPVFSVIAQVFVVDLCILLLFSFLAYQVTAAIVRPIEALSEGARRISQGQLDLEIPEPRGTDEIGLLTRTFNDMTRKLLRNQAEIHAAYAELKDRNDELQRANEVLEQLSITDGLTRLHNHRFFQDYLTREIKRVSRTREPLAMLFVDIDDFKRLNDRLGHAAGDELLIGLARILNDSIRESDLAARYGGEEFVVLAPETNLAGAVNLAEKIRTAVAESSFILDDSKQLTKMTVSVGVAQYRGNRKTFFHSADQALYRAKGAGKNCVMTEQEDDPPAPAA